MRAPRFLEPGRFLHQITEEQNENDEQDSENGDFNESLAEASSADFGPDGVFSGVLRMSSQRIFSDHHTG